MLIRGSGPRQNFRDYPERMRQMTAYKDMTLDQRRAEYAALETVFEGLKAQGLKLDMTRGKPCKAQLDMVSDIFDTLNKP